MSAPYSPAPDLYVENHGLQQKLDTQNNRQNRQHNQK